MFIGVSPFDAPAFYSVISYADHVQKIAHPRGGMYRIPKALERLARELGVTFHFNTEVRRISQNGCLTFETDAGTQRADAVVVNADYAYSQRQLLSRRVKNYDYSCSVYLLYLGMKQKVPGLEHHNLFFAKDLRKNLRDIFTGKAVSDDLSFYVHVPTVTDPSLAPSGKDILYILIPVANLEHYTGDFTQVEKRLRRVVFDTIDAKLGVRLEDLIEVEHRFYPKDFITRYNVEKGATFGLAHTLMQSAFFRPANRDPRIPDLYYVGASTQPGGGLPPVIASSKIVADLIEGR
jgi:phytoene desaturase